MATWASQVRLILWFLTFWCDAKKSSFVDALPIDRKNQKNRAGERQRIEKVPPARRRREVSGRDGFPGSIESRTLWPLDHPERIPTRRWAEGPANIYIYIYLLIYLPIASPGPPGESAPRRRYRAPPFKFRGPRGVLQRRKGTIRTQNPRKSLKSIAEISNRQPKSQIDCRNLKSSANSHIYIFFYIYIYIYIYI